MAEFGPRVTGISEPSLKSASFINPGVVDKSAAMGTMATTNLTKGIVEQGLEAYKGAQVGEINTLTQDAIQEYMNRRENPEIAKESLTEAASVDFLSNIFPQPGADLSAVEQAQQERYATYQQALQEGVMTPDEFSDRILSHLRETTNKNPGLAQELKAEASRVMELSGITGIQKSDQLIKEGKEKQLKDAMDDMRRRATSQGIYHDVTTPYWELADKVKVAEDDDYSFNTQVRGKDRFAMISAVEARKWVESKGDSVVRGSLTNTNKTLQSMVDTLGVNTSSYPKFKSQFEASLDNMHQVFVDSISVSIRQDPLVQDKIKAHADGMEKIKTRLANLATGEDMKKILSNEVEILKLGQQKELRQNFDVEQIGLMGDILRGIPGLLIESPVRKRYEDVITSIASGNFSSPALRNIAPKSSRDNTSESIVKASINAGKLSGSYTGFKRTMDAVNSETARIEDPKTKVQFLFNNLSALAKEEPLQMDTESISKVETHIGLLLNDNQFGLPTLAETTQGKKVKMDVLPNGQLMFIGEDADKFNRVYGNNINIALKAYANSHGIPMETAKKRFYPQYFGPFIGVMADKDIK